MVINKLKNDLYKLTDATFVASFFAIIITCFVFIFPDVIKVFNGLDKYLVIKYDLSFFIAFTIIVYMWLCALFYGIYICVKMFSYKYLYGIISGFVFVYLNKLVFIVLMFYSLFLFFKQLSYTMQEETEQYINSDLKNDQFLYNEVRNVVLYEKKLKIWEDSLGYLLIYLLIAILFIRLSFLDISIYAVIILIAHVLLEKVVKTTLLYNFNRKIKFRAVLNNDCDIYYYNYIMSIIKRYTTLDFIVLEYLNGLKHNYHSEEIQYLCEDLEIKNNEHREVYIYRNIEQDSINRYDLAIAREKYLKKPYKNPFLVKYYEILLYIEARTFDRAFDTLKSIPSNLINQSTMNRVMYHYLYGLCLYRTNKYDEAKKFFEQVYKLGKTTYYANKAYEYLNLDEIRMIESDTNNDWVTIVIDNKIIYSYYRSSYLNDYTNLDWYYSNVEYSYGHGLEFRQSTNQYFIQNGDNIHFQNAHYSFLSKKDFNNIIDFLTANVNSTKSNINYKIIPKVKDIYLYIIWLNYIKEYNHNINKNYDGINWNTFDYNSIFYASNYQNQINSYLKNITSKFDIYDDKIQTEKYILVKDNINNGYEKILLIYENKGNYLDIEDQILVKDKIIYLNLNNGYLVKTNYIV